MKSTAAKPTLTPKLRFPEFRDGPGWSEKKLGGVGDILMCKRVFANETNDSGGVPFYKIGTLGGAPDAYITKELFDDYRSRYNYPRVGEVLITCSGTVGKCLPYDGRDAYYQDSNIVWIDNPTHAVSNEFLLRILTNINWGKLNSTTITRIYGPDLKGLLIRFPKDTAEQHKIASCLSSLDDLIAAERQKLDALKAHKKGLMQQLFPREGETRPRLRFTEFRKAGEWETKVGGDLFTNRKEDGETGLPIYSVTVNDGMVPRASLDRDFYDIEDPAGNKKACKGDIAYNMMRMWQGAQGAAPEDCMVSPAYVVLNPGSGVCSDFFAYLFKLPQSLRLLTATSRGLTKDRLRLYFDDFAKMRLCVPEIDEQHRIASCLSSLDGLIAAQSDKLEVLKTHKKGLMQQLFPSPSEVEV